MLGLIAKLTIKEGKMDEALDLFKGLVADVKTEEGTISYTVNKDTAAPNVIVVVERYKDADALTVHSSTPHFAAFSKQIRGLLDGKMEMSILEEIASI
jgi:quinol monooxygenase YgiN